VTQGGSIVMSGTGGTSPKTKNQKMVWWAAFGIFFLFVVYVLARNFLL
jgi:hypothetical protein